MRILPLALAVLLAAACGGAAKKDPVPAAAPDFALADLSGRTVRLADFRGKIVLVDFWATWCDPCRESIPEYVKLDARLRSSGLVILGIDEDDKTSGVGAFAASHEMTYPVLLDRRRRAFDAFGVRGLPTAVLIDGAGVVRERWSGFDAATAADEEREIGALLAAPPRK